MKTLLFLMTISLSFSMIPLNAQTPSPSEEEVRIKRKSEILPSGIKGIIAQETQAYLDNDFKAWVSTFAQYTIALQVWNTRSGYNSNVGYDAVISRTGRNRKKHTNLLVSPVLRKNFTIRIYEQTAFVTFDQYSGNKNGKARRSREMRLLEKKDEEWKIAVIASFWDYKRKYKIADLK